LITGFKSYLALVDVTQLYFSISLQGSVLNCAKKRSRAYSKAKLHIILFYICLEFRLGYLGTKRNT
jgi:hypothetical protein